MKKIVVLLFSLLILANGSLSAQWIKIGLKDKTISSLACDRQNGSIYAVADGLLFVSDNDGLDWNQLNLDEAQPRVLRVLLDAEGRIYAGTDKGIYCSHNQDRSFRAINTGLPQDSVLFPAVTAICCLDSSLAIGTSVGVFVSGKDNIQWTAFNRNLPSEKANQLLYHHERLFLATDSGIYISPSDSAQWEQCFFSRVKDLAAKDSFIYAATQIASVETLKNGALYQSHDLGSSWEALAPDTGHLTGQAVFCDENRIWVGTFYGWGGLYSPDRGANWEYLGLEPWFTALAFAQRGSALLAGTEFYKHIDNSGGLYIQYNVFSNNSEDRPFPEFITTPGIYEDSVSLSVILSVPSESTVYYTEDGSTPDVHSKLYIEAIVVDSTTIIKAIAIFAGEEQSKVNSGLFIIGSLTDLQHSEIHNGSPLPYPNPCSDFLYLTVHEDQTQISVVNLSGQVVYSDQAVQSGSYRLNVYTLKPGLYILTMKSKHSTEKLKFIKNQD